ncbi:MAG TPA: hypothetical protein VMV95_02275 [Bacillota bacterium]|nr:hypothetical protein [Bacillota bacterium]
MNIVSRTITGLALIILGIILIVVSFSESLWVLIYGIPILLIGFFILFNKREDRIEGRRDMKGGKR